MTVEWTIENFSCWNRKIHDKVITSLQTSSYSKLELFPKGLSGQDEQLVVRICNEDGRFRFCELSFINSDGSLLCFQKGMLEMSVLELPPGPKFDDVVARIRKNEALHGDRLTLRLSEKRIDVVYRDDTVEYTSTKIDVVNFNVKICHRRFYNSNTLISLISCFKYPLDGRRVRGQINLLALKGEKTRLALKPEIFEEKFLVRIDMFVLNDDDDVARSEETEHLFRDDSTWTFSSSLVREEVILRIKVIPGNRQMSSFGPITELSLIHQGVVTVLPSAVFKFPVSEEYSFKPDNSTTVLKKELMCLFQDQDFSDFQLKCGGVSFPVHRALLSARSPVFKTMLTSDMKEAASGKMDIKDLDAPTLGLFLTYLYTGVVEDLQLENALKLYYAADKYQVPSLKRKCSNFLRVNISVSNVCDVLSLADRHRDDQLSSAARGFMILDYNAVLKSEEWKNFMKSQPLLAAETLTRLVDEKRDKVYVHERSHRSPQKSALSDCFKSILMFLCFLIIMLILFVILVEMTLPPKNPSITERLCAYVCMWCRNQGSGADPDIRGGSSFDFWVRHQDFEDEPGY